MDWLPVDSPQDQQRVVTGFEESEESTVRCADCGFLTLRDQDSRELVEAEAGWRQSVNLPQRWDGVNKDFFPLHPVYPICFERALPLGEEFQKNLEGRNANIPIEVSVAFRRVITTERLCPKFVQWRQGASPQEHRKMLDEKWKLEFDEKRRQDDLDWRAKQEKDAADRHNEQMALMRGQGRWQLWIFGGAVTFAIVVSTIVGSMIQVGWIAKPW